MKQTQGRYIIMTAVLMAACAAIVCWFHFGSIPAVSSKACLGLWVIAAFIASIAWGIKTKVQDNMIGEFSGQVSPLFVASCAALGKASAWVGAVMSGLYGGLLIVDCMKYSTVVAAREEIVNVALCCVGAIAVSIAGLWLERCCITPPEKPENAYTQGV